MKNNIRVVNLVQKLHYINKNASKVICFSLFFLTLWKKNTKMKSFDDFFVYCSIVQGQLIQFTKCS